MLSYKFSCSSFHLCVCVCMCVRAVRVNICVCVCVCVDVSCKEPMLLGIVRYSAMYFSCKNISVPCNSNILFNAFNAMIKIVYGAFLKLNRFPTHFLYTNQCVLVA